MCLRPEHLDIGVRETAQSVTVTALRDDPDDSDGCDDDEVTLASPLRDRRVIDGATGNDVPVQRS